MQMEVSKFFRSIQTKAFSGSLARNKIEGTLYINQHILTIAVVNKSNSKCKTIIKMSDKQFQRLRYWYKMIVFLYKIIITGYFLAKN